MISISTLLSSTVYGSSRRVECILLRTWEWGWKVEDGVSPTIAEFAAQCLPPDGRFDGVEKAHTPDYVLRLFIQ